MQTATHAPAADRGDRRDPQARRGRDDAAQRLDTLVEALDRAVTRRDAGTLAQADPSA